MSRTHTDATKEAIRGKSLKQGEGRTNTYKQAIIDAKIIITAEIKANEGIYPKNDGKLNLIEICRRAGKSHKTLYGPKYRDDFKVDLENWIVSISQSVAVTRTQAKKTAAVRVAEWRELYAALEATHIQVSDYLIEERRLRLEAERRAWELEKQLAQLPRNTVVRLRAVPVVKKER